MSKYILLIFALLSAVGTSCAASLEGDNCTTIGTCEECVASDCNWVQCEAYDPSCQLAGPEQFCNEVLCDNNTTTVGPPPTTEVPTTEVPTTEVPTTEVPTTEVPTTEVPTTETPTDPPTTEAPTPAPTDPPTTEAPTPAPTDLPTTEAPPTPAPTDPPTTEVPTTPSPTDPPTTETPTTTVAPPTPSGRHFDAASFFGGMVLAVAIIAVGYAAWRFYKSRSGRSYHTL